MKNRHSTSTSFATTAALLASTLTHATPAHAAGFFDWVKNSINHALTEAPKKPQPKVTSFKVEPAAELLRKVPVKKCDELLVKLVLDDPIDGSHTLVKPRPAHQTPRSQNSAVNNEPPAWQTAASRPATRLNRGTLANELDPNKTVTDWITLHEPAEGTEAKYSKDRSYVALTPPQGGTEWKTLQELVVAFLRWRTANPESFPDFSGQDFRNIKSFTASTVIPVRELVAAKIENSQEVIPLLSEMFKTSRLRNARFDGCDFGNSDLPPNVSQAFLPKLLTRFNFSGADLEGAHFAGAHLTNTKMNGSNLSRADFTGADLESARMVNVIAHETIFDDAAMTLTNLSDSDLTDARVRRANLYSTIVENTILTGVDFTQAKLRGILLGSARTLEGLKLNDAELTEIDLDNADISGLDFQVAKIMDDVNGHPTTRFRRSTTRGLNRIQTRNYQTMKDLE